MFNQTIITIPSTPSQIKVVLTPGFVGQSGYSGFSGQSAPIGISSTHTIKDGDGVSYHHYVFTNGVLVSYTKNAIP